MSTASIKTSRYCELHCLSNFTFLRGASHPEELVNRAAALGYQALAITDECSLAGIVRAQVAARANRLKLLVGSEVTFSDVPLKLVILAPTRRAYGELCQFVTTGRRRGGKGSYQLFLQDLTLLQNCFILWPVWSDLARISHESQVAALIATSLPWAEQLKCLCPDRLWLMEEQLLQAHGQTQHQVIEALSAQTGIPQVCGNDVHMHEAGRQPLQDAVTAIRTGCSVFQAGSHCYSNRERYLRPVTTLTRLYSRQQVCTAQFIADSCVFSLDELRYEYPPELVPAGITAQSHLRSKVYTGAQRRYPSGVPVAITRQIEHELQLIHELGYEHYFLTIDDIVTYARDQKILCQGRGSAANSVICYCLGITEVDPMQIHLLFERFISKERHEPPDIDVDFEHERREEVIQYIYRKYGRERAALTAAVITYRARSAIRDIGKALGLNQHTLDQLIHKIDWRSQTEPWRVQLQRMLEQRSPLPPVAKHLITLVNQIIGFPRHLSQHTGGFVISAGPMSELVPIENAAMAGRTVIQWDKNDLETLGLLKVDILALGMLSAIRKTLDLIGQHRGTSFGMQNIPREDPAVYQMLQEGDSIGVFQVESRAQISMLTRLKPACFYDLVIEVAIVRPGPIQGGMVHPYLRRRQGLEPAQYSNQAIQEVLGRTLGVPIFQEQVIKLAMVAAGFTAGAADQLRRAMATWSKHGDLTAFQQQLKTGMIERGHCPGFADQICQQITGFGEYGFPESHAASFALLVYISAWLKCHEPEAFFCSLLNSQPMGFYSPSQLVQQARRQGVNILPIDINHSDKDHRLEAQGHSLRPAVRLGFRQIRGLSWRGMQQLCQARPERGFKDLAELVSLARLNPVDMEALAAANALESICGHRYQARWDILAENHCSAPLFSGIRTQEIAAERRSLSKPTEGAEIKADYVSTGLTLARHPLALLRNQGHLQHCITARILSHCKQGQLVCVAGLVTCRQRPASAAGVNFMTLEDETGNINLIVFPATAHAQRKPLLTARLLEVHGLVERQGKTLNVVAGRLINMNKLLNGIDT